MRAHKVVTGIIAAGAIIVLTIMLRSGDTSDTSILVEKGSISETVSVTGQLEPVQSVDLSFQASGRIAYVPVKVGDEVLVGQTLASLDSSELNAQLKNAQANVAAQQAKLDGLLAGSRPEDIAVAQAQFDKAQQDLNNYYSAAQDILSSAYAYADDAVRTQLAALFVSTGSDSSPQYRVTISCSSSWCLQNIPLLADKRAESEVFLLKWRQELTNLVPGDPAQVIETILADASSYLQATRQLVNVASDVLNSTDIVIDSTTLATYRTSVSTAMTENNTALNSINSQLQSIAAQKIVVQQYASQLALKKAGSSAQDISAQRAAVLAAQAQADQIQAQISKNIIRSPIKGIVTKVDAKVGQSASANATLISVISNSQLEITANVPEIDVGRITVGNHIDFTVDALPNQTFTASVSFVDPAETIIEGVVNFKIKAVISQDEDDLKSGLTVNLEIRTRHKDDVLILPQYAIIQNDEGTFVEKINGTEKVMTPVVLGLRSMEGMVEIVSGLSEGDRVANVGLKD